MFKRVLTASIAAAVIAVGSAGVAHATMISGEMSISGGFVPIGGSTLDTATGVDFSPYNASSIDGGFSINAVNGDFAASGIGVWDPSSFSCIGGSVCTGTAKGFYFAGGPVNSLLTFGGFTFDLNNISELTQTSDTLIVKGVGTLHNASFDDTEAGWVLTGNSSGSTFSWSASVPEPGSLALLGLGLVGMGLAGRRRKNV